MKLQLKLGAWALIYLVLLATVPTVGCSGTSVAQNIVNWTPALQSAVATVDSTASLLDPADALIFTAATIGFEAASNVSVAEAKAYLANPNADTLDKMQTAILTFQQQANAALLAAAKITNPLSQQKALNGINAVSTVVTAMLALVSSIKGSTITPASLTAPKISQVLPLIDEHQSIALVAQHYGEPQFMAAYQVHQAERSLMAAGL
jgi:hypothetical protein